MVANHVFTGMRYRLQARRERLVGSTQASMLGAAEKACFAIDGNHQQVEYLKACIKYEQNDFSGSRMILEQASVDNFDNAVNLGCCLYMEGNYERALRNFSDALSMLGFQPQLVYNKALCFYQLKFYNQARESLIEIFEHGVREYPELTVRSHVEGVELRSVGNSRTLKCSQLVEAFNLKAAIDYAMGNFEDATEALTDMPPRVQEELDYVTLHNQALLDMECNPTAGFHKLIYLLENPPFPLEVYSNLLLLCCEPSHNLLNLAAGLMGKYPELTSRSLSQDVCDFLEAIISAQESPEKYIPVLMKMAKTFWDKENYAQVEKMLNQSVELCRDHPIWRANIAHTFFMQDNGYTESIHYYEQIVKEAGDNVLCVPSDVLANLCVSYIMTSQGWKKHSKRRL